MQLQVHTFISTTSSEWSEEEIFCTSIDFRSQDLREEEDVSTYERVANLKVYFRSWRNDNSMWRQTVWEVKLREKVCCFMTTTKLSFPAFFVLNRTHCYFLKDASLATQKKYTIKLLASGERNQSPIKSNFQKGESSTHFLPWLIFYWQRLTQSSYSLLIN